MSFKHVMELGFIKAATVKNISFELVLSGRCVNRLINDTMEIVRVPAEAPYLPYAATRAQRPPAETGSFNGPRPTNVDFLLLGVGRTCRCGSDKTYSNRLRMSAVSA